MKTFNECEQNRLNYNSTKIIKVKTTKSNDSIIYLQFQYSYKNTKKSISYYRCIKKNCNAVCYVSDSGDIKSIGEHIHKPLTEREFLKLNIMKNIKKSALSSFHDPKQIIASAISDLDNNEKSILPKISSIKKVIRRYRVNADIYVPKEDCEIPENYFYDIDGYRFIQFYMPKDEPNRFIVLLNDKNIKHLRYLKIWYVDGTFKSCPFEFYQIFIIHASINGKILPFCYILLQNKTKEQYIQMFKKIKALIMPKK